MSPQLPNESLYSRRHFTATLGTLGALAAFKSQAASPGSRTRVGVIGHTGKGNFGHGLHTMWLNLPETEIVGLADPDAKGRAAALQQVKLTRGFADYREMLAETRPEIAVIASANIDLHLDPILAAVDAGVRGIYVEKPFCPTLQEADRIVTACERRNVKLAIAHRNRYHPVLPVVAKMIQDGAIGRLLEMRGRGKEDTRGGSQDLWILGSHVVNIMHYFGGEPLACSATVWHEGRLLARRDLKPGGNGVGPLGGDAVHARFDLARGIPAYFDSLKSAGNSAAGFGLQLIGTSGIIDFRMDREPFAHLLAGSPFQPVKVARKWEAIGTAGLGVPEPIPNLGKQVMGHLTAARDLIAAMREDRQPLCNAREARVTVEMISGVFESHRQGGKRVTLPLPNRSHPFDALA